MEKEKVNWRFEYMRDNIFNIVIAIMTIVILLIEGIPNLVALLPLGCSLFINTSSMQFFNKRKYY